MFVVRLGGKVQAFVMAGIVVAQEELVARVNVMIRIHQALNLVFNIDKLAHVEHRTVHEKNFAANDPLMRAAFVKGHVEGLRDGTGFDQVLVLPEIGLN